MKVLLFGGTRFMGRYVLRALLDVGVEVTIANRGTREENKGAQNIICDRSQPGALEQFKDSHFDAVIDLRSGSCNGTNVSCLDATGTAGTETLNATGLILSG